MSGRPGSIIGQAAAKGLALRRRVSEVPLSNLFQQALGRFETTRRTYSRVTSAAQTLGLVRGISVNRSESLFEVNALELASGLRRDAFFPLCIPRAHVDEMVEFSKTHRRQNWVGGIPFDQREVHDGLLPNGAAVSVSDVLDAHTCGAANAVAHDQTLVDGIAHYLGYQPMHVAVRIVHSFASSLSNDARRRSGQTIDFHFDLNGYNFVYANFYLTDVTLASGAHEMVLGSHSSKPLEWLLGSARRTDEEILRQYDRKRILLIEGQAGSGFVQDSSCYHKAHPVTSTDRLMLHLRYS